MRSSTSAWRTQLSRARAAGIQPPALPGPALAVAGAPYVLPDDVAEGMPWKGVPWSLTMVGLMVYLWTVVTYAIALGQPGMAVAVLGLFLLDRPLRFPPFLLLLGGFILWAWAGALVSNYPSAVIRGVQDMGKVWLIAFAVVNALHGRAAQRWFMFFFLAAFAMYPTRGALFNYIFGYAIAGRTYWNNIYRNPNDLAALTLMQIGMAGAFMIREPKGWTKLAALAGCGLLPVIVLMTQSRGAFIGLVLFGIFVLARQQPKMRLRAIASVAVVTTLVALFAPASAWDRMRGLQGVTDTENLDQVDSSADQRFEIWKVARTVIRENPLFGVGLRSYPQEHAVRSVDTRFRAFARGPRDAHSTYLTVMGETGIPGFLLWMGVMVSVIVHAERARRRAKHVLPRSAQQVVYLELGLIAFLISGIFGSYSHLAFTSVHVAILWAVAETIRQEADALHQAGLAPAAGGAAPAAPGAGGALVPAAAARRLPPGPVAGAPLQT